MWKRLVLLLAMVALADLQFSTGAAALDTKQVNEAVFPPKKDEGRDPAWVKAQVLLDRAHFSPGVIDGRGGENTRKAVAAYQRSNRLTETSDLDEKTWNRLIGVSDEPILTEYKITKHDLGGPFTNRIPNAMEQQAKLDRLGYRNARELLAEKFHMDEGLLTALNPGKSFDAEGSTIVVAAVHSSRAKVKVSKIEIDKDRAVLRVYGKDGELVAAYPATIGSDEKPAPSGTLTVQRVAKNPTYSYDPKYDFKGVKTDKPFTIARGPNNPVGLVWIALSKEGYGIHGTPEPAKISKTYSHGCIRLTNWDASELAGMVQEGTSVHFVGHG